MAELQDEEEQKRTLIVTSAYLPHEEKIPTYESNPVIQAQKLKLDNRM